MAKEAKLKNSAPIKYHIEIANRFWATNGTQLLFINFGEKETAYCLPAVAKAREAGIRTEMHHILSYRHRCRVQAHQRG